MGPKMLYLGIFGLVFQKKFVRFEINTLEFEYLTHTMNFGIRSAFAKGSGSAFFQGSVQG